MKILTEYHLALQILLMYSICEYLQLKCMDGHFFPGHPYIESTTVLSDKFLIDNTSV